MRATDGEQRKGVSSLPCACKEESRCVNDLTLRSRGDGVVGGAEERLITSRRFDEAVGESESPERHHDTGAVKRDDES